jgi:hypothetical protein
MVVASALASHQIEKSSGICWGANGCSHVRGPAKPMNVIAAVNGIAAVEEDRMDVARELWKMAQEYQAEAAKLEKGKLPESGSPPQRVED